MNIGRQLSDKFSEFKPNGYVSQLKLLYYVAIFFGFILRVIVSLQAWGMKHPDEIYQSLEMAHYLVYDAAYVPPEFRSTYPSIPSYAAARSWLFPMFFAGFMYIGEFLGLNYHTQTLPLIKFYMAIHATLLIPAVYKLTKQITKDDMSATLSAIFVAFWFRVVEYTVRTFTNTFFLPLIFYGVYKVLRIIDNEESLNFANLLEIGFFLGLSTYIRVDMGIIVFAFFIAYFNSDHIFDYLKIGLGSFVFWVWGAWIDYNQYDGAKFFSVIINWFTFNIIEGHSAIFGVSGPFIYIGLAIFKDLLYPWFIIILLWPIASWFFKVENSIFSSEIGIAFRRLFVANTVAWIIYSNLWPLVSLKNGIQIYFPLTHKELRFIIGAIVMFLMLAALLVRLLIAELPVWYSGIEKTEPDMFLSTKGQLHKYRRWVFTGLIVLFLTLSMIGAQSRAHPDNHEGINRGLVYIGSEVDSSPDAVYIAEVWFVTGYYTYSHFPTTTDFNFVPFHHDFGGSHYIRMTNITINAQPNSTYLIIPWYGFNAFENLLDILYHNNWTLLYQNNGVYTWGH